jgi:uncharacterized protein (DUF1501 family)
MSGKLSRRQILTGATLAAAAGAASGVGRNLSALASVTVGGHPHRTGCDALVVLFLRGGADGLNVVAPHGDDHYFRLRPNLALARPNDASADPKACSLDLNGFFGLHPALAPLLPFYKSGQLAVIHAVGSGDQTRSHFEAMATMERGLAGDTGASSGWLARHLNATAAEGDSPLRAVAVNDTMPESLRGATAATALTSLSDYRIAGASAPPTGADNRVHHLHTDRTDAIAETLRGLYSDAQAGPEALRSAGQETLAALEAVKRLDPANYRPAAGANYPKTPLGSGFRQAACLIKGRVGLEVACLDMGGWDTHVAQGRDAGWQPIRLAELGGALAAFATDLGAEMAHVTTVVMTEFGRRAYENTGLGTDHGRASCMFLLGGGIRGGKVYADWPGLADAQLVGPGDLRVTTDYRDILAELVARRLHNPQLAEVFPDYTPHFRNVTV